MATFSSSGTRHLEMRALYQGFCYLRTLSPPPSSSASWRKRYALILECGLVFFDPEAGRGSPVDKIHARDMQGVGLLPHDPEGCTLEIFLLAPPSTLQVHLGTTSITQRWLHILLNAIIPQAHNSISSRDKEPFSSLPEVVHGHVQMLSVSGHPRLSKSSIEDHMKVHPETKHLSRRAESLKKHTVSSENMQLLIRSHDTNKNCMELASKLPEIFLSKEELKCTSSWSFKENMERLSGDVLVENNLIPYMHTLSFNQPSGLVIEGDNPSSGPLSMLGSPESESLRKLEEISSEDSISGLTLTSGSSEAVEGLALEGFELQEPLVEGSSNANISILTSGDKLPSNDALPGLSASISAEAWPTSNPVQEPSLQRLNKELRASLSLQKVKQSMGPISLHQEHTQEEDRCVENGEKLKAVKINQFTEKKDFMDVFEVGETFDSEEVIQRPRTFIKRSYLHIHILECWLKEGALDEHFQDGAKSTLSYFNIVACLYHGGEKLAQSHELSTNFVLGCTNLRWNELLTFPILLYDLPQEVRLNLALYHGMLYSTDQVESKMIGWTNFCFIDENGLFKSKKHNLKLWKDPPFYSCGTVAENTTDDFCGVLGVKLDQSAYMISLHHRDDIDTGFSQDGSHCLPSMPFRLKVNGFDVEKCKYMDSKKLPLWLVFKTADKTVEEPIFTMFKAGDDLRQDMLTLQLMKIMEKLWSKSSLDLRMNVYGCVSTGLSDGFLEIVRNAETLSNIASKHGGGAKAVFRVETLQNWLVSNNRTGEDYTKAVDNFVRSCAAYCVATCVLGIGDRHNDNVMIKRTGEFFRILAEYTSTVIPYHF